MPKQETLLNISTDPFSQPVCHARYHHTQSRCAVKAQRYCEVRRRLAPKTHTSKTQIIRTLKHISNTED